MRIVSGEVCVLKAVPSRPNVCPFQIGVSSDSVEKQKEFATKNDLNYTLLADTKKEVRKAYGVGGTALLGLAARESRLYPSGRYRNSS